MRAPPLKSISSSDVGLLDPINPPNLSRTLSSLSLMETDEKRQPSWSQEHEPELEKWNGTRTNAFRYVATLYSFIVMGMNDGAVGVRFPPKRSSETIADDYHRPCFHMWADHTVKMLLSSADPVTD